MMEMAVPGRRKRGRPRRRRMNLAREPWKVFVLRKETRSIGSNGKYFRAVATRNRKKPKEEEEYDPISRCYPAGTSVSDVKVNNIG